ncbi:MAG: hypothetical protein KGL46_03235 [Hyphomicrobiales bacterium]|nr:hypothetical protein [Hyphomicrobiales bacterium]
MNIKSLGLVGFAVIAVYAYDRFDKSTNYQRTQARLTKVDEVCYMEKTEGKRTSTSDTLPCQLAEIAVKSHPKWMDYTVKRKIAFEFSFVSPVDGKIHSSKLSAAAFPNGKPLQAGDVVEVLASKKQAETTRWL